MPLPRLLDLPLPRLLDLPAEQLSFYVDIGAPRGLLRHMGLPAAALAQLYQSSSGTGLECARLLLQYS